MKGTTYKVESGNWSQLVKLDSGACLLISRQGWPHMWCETWEDAIAVAEPKAPPKPWSETTESKDDQWSNKVEFRNIEQIKAISDSTYGPRGELAHARAHVDGKASSAAPAPAPDPQPPAVDETAEAEAAARKAEAAARVAEAEAAQAEATARKASAEAATAEAEARKAAASSSAQAGEA